MGAPAASVIVTTYNRPAALRLVLEALLAQSRDDFEVLVADDGSGESTRETVDAFLGRYHGRLQHVWQEDRGFRAGAARNRALERASGGLACFLDGDCIPRPGFVDGHLRHAREGRILRGARVLMDERLTGACEADPASAPHAWSKSTLRDHVTTGRVNRSSPLRGGLLDRIRMLASSLRRRNWKLLRGCNFSVSMQLVRQVHGFDEAFVGWGYEDSDLCIRLMNHGLRIARGPAGTCVLHLWHRENDRRFEGENLDRLMSTLRSGRVLPNAGMRVTVPA